MRNWILRLFTIFAQMHIIAASGNDVHWSPQFGSPGLSASVASIHASPDGEVMACEINGSMRFWNGRSWRTIGKMEGIQPIASAILKHNSIWYAAGPFKGIDGAPISRVAAWDGDRWSAVGADPGGSPEAIAIHRDELYVAGWPFNETNVFIKKWTGSTWIDLGSSQFTGGLTSALISDGTYLYAGGAFNLTGANVARWDGIKWEPVGVGVDVAQGSLALKFAIFQNELYAISGPRLNLTTLFLHNLWKWNGSEWISLGRDFKGKDLSALAVWNDSLYITGNFSQINGEPISSIARYDGQRFYPLSGSGGGFALSATPQGLFLAGGFDYLGIDPSGTNLILAPRIGVWNGTSFANLYNPETSNGVGPFVQALGKWNGKLYAGGIFRAAGDSPANYIAAWDGRSWARLGSGLENSGSSSPVRVNAITPFMNELFVGGTFNRAGGVPVSNIAIWDGQSWRPAGPGFNGTVVQLAEHNGQLLAAGGFTQSGSSTVSYVAAWNGLAWEQMGCCLSGAGVTEMATIGDRLFVAGRLLGEGGATNSVYELVNGTFTFLGGFDKAIGSMASFNEDLYVGGDFQLVNGIPIPRFAKWNGITWSSVASTLDAGVAIITVHSQKLYIGGLFKNSTTVAGLNGIARLETDWQSLGSGFSNAAAPLARVDGLCSIGDDLFAGGNFTQAGSANSAYVARWNDSIDFYATSNNLPKLEFISFTDNTVTIRGSVPAGAEIVLESSTDLVNWSSIKSYTGTFTYIGNANGKQQFYRISM